MAELEDTSKLVKIDTEALQEVNEPAWLAFDAVCAFLVTYFTHDADDMPIHQRFFVMAFILASSYIMQSLYFTAGLDRPSSGQMKIDKWWHMAITHFGNSLFYWQWIVQLHGMVVGWIDNNVHPLVALTNFCIGFLVVMLIIDMIAGFVHWFGDTTQMYFFQYHHDDSRYMTRQSYVHHCWDTVALAIALSLIVTSMNNTVIGSSVRFIACQANECHMWAHCTSREVPPFIKLLQKMTLVLSWKAHMHHHKPPHLIDYCVFNGWANPIMNQILPGYATEKLGQLRDTKNFQALKKLLDT